MGIADSIKKGFSVVKQSMDLVGVLFVFGAVWNVISVFVSPANPNPDAAAVARIVVIGLVFVLLSVFVQAGSLGYIRERLKQGKAALSDFFQAGSKYYVRILLLGLLIALIAGVLILLAALGVAAFANAGQALKVLGVILALLFASLGIYFALLLFLAPYAIVVDQDKVMPAIKKSIALVKQNILKVLGIMLILVAIGFAVGILLGLIFAAVTASAQGAAKAAQIVFGILSSLVNAVLGVVVSGAFMSFYLAISNTANTSDAK